MNIRSAELLENSLQNTADNLYRNRALAASMQEEAQRNAVEQSFRNAMMQHYANIEQKQADAGDRQAGVLQQQQQQAGMAQKQDFLRAAMQLNATGQLSSDGLKRVNQWLSTDPDMSKTGIQLSTPPNPSDNPAHQQMALANALDLRQQYQDKYDAETDPGKRAVYGKVLDDIDHSLGGKRTGDSPRSSKPAASPGTTAPAASANASDNLSGQSFTPPTGNAAPLTPLALPAQTPPLSAPPLNSNGIPTGQPDSQTQQQQPTGPVRVRRPDGTTTTIPAAHLQAAMQYGYKPITQ